ncbi:helix-turn-helix protein [Tenacibaculum adriaticum]|uniref:Helix-turn-helix protein n=1 Tax=Tenacibaculum adriaticum TaxID=413713 RepID=A0A5S5DUZ2_9FLAO|nr:helix-turn-helix domain-containing protein [Tenacibaculum adriaticum]TYP99088.1 helix-turn-helix protein [Tenacibaculum adriaticum]
MPSIKKILLLSFIFSIQILLSQNSPLDSLLNKSYDELSELFYQNETDTVLAQTYADAFFLKAKKKNDTLGMLRGKYYISDVHNLFDSYINYCDSLISRYQNSKSKKTLISIHLRKSEFFLLQNKNGSVLKECIAANFLLKKQRNDSLQAITNIYLGILKGENGEEDEALKLLKNANEYVKKCKNFHKNSTFNSLPLNISFRYRKKGDVDSAYYYLDEAEKLYSKINDSVFIKATYFSRAQVDYSQKKYISAITNYNKSLSGIEEDNNYNLLTQIYTKLGFCYEKTNNNSKAFKYHLKADSLYNVVKIPSNHLEDSFLSLSKYYKNKNDLKKQLIYINKLLELKEFRLNDKKYISETLSEKYDIPNLLKEREKVINELKGKSKTQTIIYASSIILILSVLTFQIKRKRNYKKKFLTVINQNKIPEKKEMLPKNIISNLSQEVIDDINQKLSDFEKNNEFLDSATSLQSLATKLNTNSNYLSKVINQSKELSFSNYINQLRIDYTIQKLKENTLFRKYTIKAIAEEVGFKNAESFSKAFSKSTGLRPSYFIKELEKNNTF